jgi:toxin ParE1/3/4
VLPAQFQPTAHREFERAIARFESKREGLGEEFRDEIREAIREIRNNPKVGAPYGRTRYRYYVVRRFRYVVFYKETAELIWIAAVAHGHRRPGYWRRRRLG